MRVKFLKDVFNAGTKFFETGKVYEGDLAVYVRRGQAEEVKEQLRAAESGAVKDEAKPKGKPKK